MQSRYPHALLIALFFSPTSSCTADPEPDAADETTTTTSTATTRGTETSSSESSSSLTAVDSSTSETTTTSESSSESTGSVAPPVTASVAVGHVNSCVLTDDGRAKCWGINGSGELGQGNTVTIGDDETPSSIPAIDLGGPAIQLSVGGAYTCALLDGGDVRCWGYNGYGNLGYANTDSVGDDETPAEAGSVDVGGPVAQIASGEGHTCARLVAGTVRCWGSASDGQLGYANETPIGDDETPASAGDVPLGGTAVWIAAGRTHTCAVLDTGSIRCWGNGFGGALGYGNLEDIGDDETPAATGDVPLGMLVDNADVGYSHSCARSAAGIVRCWGDSQSGALGYGNTAIIGDDEPASAGGDVDVGGAVAQLALGYNGFTCARLDSGSVRCWGNNFFAALGYGNMLNVGDDEVPADVGDVDIGGVAIDVSAGDRHVCVVLDDGAVRCWGNGEYGVLGYGDTMTIGDDETPGSVGTVEVW